MRGPSNWTISWTAQKRVLKGSLKLRIRRRPLRTTPTKNLNEAIDLRHDYAYEKQANCPTSELIRSGSITTFTGCASNIGWIVVILRSPRKKWTYVNTILSTRTWQVAVPIWQVHICHTSMYNTCINCWTIAMFWGRKVVFGHFSFLLGSVKSSHESIPVFGRSDVLLSTPVVLIWFLFVGIWWIWPLAFLLGIFQSNRFLEIKWSKKI